jgi:hypothetical protein
MRAAECHRAPGSSDIFGRAGRNRHARSGILSDTGAALSVRAAEAPFLARVSPLHGHCVIAP